LKPPLAAAFIRVALRVICGLTGLLRQDDVRRQSPAQPMVPVWF